MIKNGLLDGGSVGGDDVLVILGKISNSMGLIRQAHTTEMAVCVCKCECFFVMRIQTWTPPSHKHRHRHIRMHTWTQSFSMYR